jgi:eukaryotic-like serine/threonine-protein kinase
MSDAGVKGATSIEHLLTDQRQSWLRGQCAQAEDYLRWSPDLTANPKSLVELLVNEFRLRAELGHAPERREFEQRFPQLADALRRALKLAGLAMDDTVVPECEASSGPDGTETEPSVVADGSTQFEASVVDQSLNDRTEVTDAHVTDAPTSLIEASEAIVRELAERGGSGREMSPNQSTIVQMLQDALRHSSQLRRRPPTPLRAVPGYDIQAELGRGAVGVVYKARQQGLNRIVALKMILAGGHASRTTLARFRAEAEAVASLQHGNIVQVYEIGECDGLPFFSLEYCAGGSLADRLKGTPLAAEIAARTIVKLARAMHYAHGCKVVHRDLKPGNILLHPKDDAGRPAEPAVVTEQFDFESVIFKISDFGLAKRLDEDSQTKTGAVLGTPSYMAPEQASGKIHAVGPPADIYALGAILYEFLTGRPPFRAATALDTVVQVINDEPVAPRRLQSGVPADLETIALKCLEKDPLKRYESAAALADDAQRFLDGEPILARPIGIVERTLRWCRRNPVVASLMALAAFSMILGTAISLYFAQQAHERAVVAIQNEGRARRERETARRNQYVAEMNLVQRAWRDVEMARVRSLLRAQAPQSDSDTDFRGPEWHYWNRLANDDLATIPSEIGGEPCLALSPDGHFVAAAGKDRVIGVWDIATGQNVARLSGHTDAIVGLAYLPDGRLLSASTARETDGGRSFVRGAEILTWGVGEKQRLNRRVIPADAELTRFAVDAAGRHWALAFPDGTVLVVRASDGTNLQTLTGPGDAAISVGLTADGGRVAAGFANGDVLVWNVANGQRLKALNRPNWVAHCVNFSADGRRLAVGGGNASVNDAGVRLEGDVRIWDIDSWRLLAEMRGHGGSVLSVAFSSDGQRVATASNDRTVRVWDSLTGQSVSYHQGHERASNAAIFSADGRLVVSASDDATIRFWDAMPPRNRTALGGDSPGRVAAWALSPNDRLIAIGLTAGESPTVDIAIYDLLTQERIRLVPVLGKAVLSLTWRPDGRALSAVVSSTTTQIAKIDPETGQVKWTVLLPLESVVDAVYSPDGHRLAVAGQSRIVVFEDESAAEIERTESPKGRIATLGFLGTGGIRAVSVSGPQAIVWDSNDAISRRTLIGHQEAIMSVAMSSDQRMVATGAADQSVRMWDADSGRDLLGRDLPGHVSPVTALAFSPDGRRLASAGQDFDRTVRVWDVVTGQELLVLSGSSGQEPRLAFSGRGSWLVAQRERLAVWDLRPLQPSSALERAALTAARFHLNGPSIRDDALRSLQSDPSLRIEARELAMQFAASWPDSPDRYADAAWSVLRSPYGSKAAYDEAARWTDQFRRLNADSGAGRVLAGIARYRLGDWAQARQILEDMTGDNAGSPWAPARQVVLTMAKFRLGLVKDATVALGQLSGDPAAAAVPELMNEARNLIQSAGP